VSHGVAVLSWKRMSVQFLSHDAVGLDPVPMNDIERLLRELCVYKHANDVQPKTSINLILTDAVKFKSMNSQCNRNRN
jgi:hypothetical protein